MELKLPPRGDPRRLDAMALNVQAGRSVFAGDDGTAVPYPLPPTGSAKAPINPYFTSKLVGTKGLYYFGPRAGWYICPNTEFRSCPEESRDWPEREKPKYRFRLTDRPSLSKRNSRDGEM